MRKVGITSGAKVGVGRTSGLSLPDLRRDTQPVMVNNDGDVYYALLHNVLKARGCDFFRWSPFEDAPDGWNLLMTIHRLACRSEEAHS